MTSPAAAAPSVESRAELWSQRQLGIVSIVNLTGLVVIVIAYSRSASIPTLGGQISWINAAILGLVIALAADGLLLFLGRRAIGRRRLQVLPNVVVNEAQDPVADPDAWLWVRGTSRAHRPGCQLVVGKSTVTADRSVIRAERLRRCELCG